MRRQLAVFVIALALTGVLSLVNQARVLADLAAFYEVPDQGILATTVILTPDTGPLPAGSSVQSELQQAQRQIEHRLELLDLSRPDSVDVGDGYLKVTLPGHENTPYIVNIISSRGELTFIDGGETAPPLGQRVQTGPYTRPDRHIYQALFTGQEVKMAEPPDAGSGQIFYRLALHPAAAGRFADFVEERPDAYICMVLDGRVINCSRMYHQAGNIVEILPDLSSGSAISLSDLEVFLESGPLPMPLHIAMN